MQTRRADYGLAETERLDRESGDPMSAEMIEVLRNPPAPAEVITHAGSLAFAA